MGILSACIKMNDTGKNKNIKKIFEAFDKNETTKVLSILKKSPEMIKITFEEKNNDTPLHIASRKGNFEVVKYLVQEKANINAQNNKGDTALILASDSNHLGIVDYLIQNDAVGNITNNEKKTALDKVISILNMREGYKVDKSYVAIKMKLLDQRLNRENKVDGQSSLLDSYYTEKHKDEFYYQKLFEETENKKTGK